ncbi:MAG: DHH family phosphoesterase [Oscillospiraceae bacterium]
MTRAEFCAFVRGHDNFVILTHRRPDGDTIGCASALCLGLRQLGKSAAVLRNEQFTPRFAALLEGLVCEDAPADACVISTDIASEGLLSFDAVRLELTPVCAVDHHGSNSLACPKLVEADKAACGEIVHALLTELGVTVTKRIAECLHGDLHRHGLLQIFQHECHHPLHRGVHRRRGGCVFINKVF